MKNDSETSAKQGATAPGIWTKTATKQVASDTIEYEVRYERSLFHRAWRREWTLHQMTPLRRWAISGLFALGFATVITLVIAIIRVRSK